jgi:polyferredoxin
MSPPRSAVSHEADLLRWPVIGAVLRWRRVRTASQLVLLAIGLVIVVHGLLGPDLAPKNLATVLTWIHYRALLIGVLLAVGNAFCGACPIVLVRDLGRRLHAPARRWPRWAADKRLAIVLFVGVLFAYELFDLWALPAATAWLVIAYFATALVVDLTFAGGAFCKYVCPVGQFSFLVSTLSPLELKIRDAGTCASCTTADCVRGRRDPVVSARVIQRGCELDLFLPSKVGNLDCTFCLDCVQACPHDNVAIGARVPGEELVDDRRRSSIGRLSRRPDLAVLAAVFTFSAMLNAFAMVGPVHATEAWIARAMHTTHETPVLAAIFVVGVGLLPLVLYFAAAAATRRLAASPLGVRDIAVRYAYALVPFGVGTWLSHYWFHLLTAVGTVVPVTQSALIDLTGVAVAGEPSWRWLGLKPGSVFPIQVGAVLLGALGSLALAYTVSERDHPRYAARATVPWALLVLGLAAAAIWILAQPMEMRGTTLGG